MQQATNKDSTEQEALERSPGGFTTKIADLTDTLGNTWKCMLTPGQSQRLDKPKKGFQMFLIEPFLGDQGHDTNSLIKQLSDSRCVGVIPSRKNRKEPRE